MSGIVPNPQSMSRGFWSRTMPLALALSILAPATPAVAQAYPPSALAGASIRDEIAAQVKSDLRPFYAARGYRPIWLDQSGRPGPAADLLLKRIETARLDAVKPSKLKAGSLRQALRRASGGDFEDAVRAELKLSEAYARYVQAMRRVRSAEMSYESDALAPVVPSAANALTAAAAQGSLESNIRAMGWMHPFYAPMRDALLDNALPPRQRAVIWQNLDRIRSLPGTPPEKYVLVDAVTARLWMYENGKPVDSMRVVVGKNATQTPAMAGFMRYAIVNPYWNVPVDLVQTTIANNVLDKGLGYLKTGGYQVLSDWTANPKIFAPQAVDWHAVAAGAQQVRVRQLPGQSNFMGKVKFEFPNSQGIYLHDTPNKDLLRLDGRQLSNGCVRLEDAARFGRWLLDKRLPATGKKPEQRIDLPQLAPIYITYLTAIPENGTITFHSDVYGRDGATRFASAR